ncbi:MAG: cytochrome b [Pseudomonadota bacterium]|nr:cytochrome b [Pseudomonadota bacterium]
MKSPVDRWGRISQFLHWLMALAVIAMATIGLLMVDMANTPRKIEIYALHKSLGLTVLALVVLRLAWRGYAGRPAPLPGTPRWQERLATAVHFSLYALLFAMPLSGWLFNSAAGYPLQWFGWFNLPALSGENRDLRELAGTLHEVGFWLLLGLVIVHAGAAVYHHVFLNDSTLTRMLPRRRPKEPTDVD